MTSRRTGRVSMRWASACVAVLACRGSGPAETPAERTAFVARSCPALELGSEPLKLKDARLFVEVVDVQARNLPQPLAGWLQQNAVTVRSSANLVAFPNVPTTMPWGQCVDTVCSSAQLSITLTARLPERVAAPIQLALRIDEAAAEGSDAAPRTLLDTTLQLLHQQPAVLPPAAEVSDGSLIVTGYLLRRLEDLHAVMSCQAQQAEQAKALD
ncbi:MAG: hypothetical protein RL685_4002 [Pseudomonadota bacterium]